MSLSTQYPLPRAAAPATRVTSLFYALPWMMLDMVKNLCNVRTGSAVLLR